jgi:hypothetical protein
MSTLAPAPEALQAHADPTFSDEDIRGLVEEAVRTARDTTPGNVSDAAVVQWTMEDRYIEGRWRSTLEPEGGPFSEDEARHLVTEAMRRARNHSRGNMADEACVQRVMRDAFGDEQGWHSTLAPGFLQGA